MAPATERLQLMSTVAPLPQPGFDGDAHRIGCVNASATAASSASTIQPISLRPRRISASPAESMSS
jgi:hypothetical protein